MNLPGILAAPLPHGDHPYDHGRDPDYQDNQLEPIEIVTDQRQPFRGRLKILCIKRCNTLQQHISICHAQHQPQDADDDPDEHSSFKEIYNGKCNKNHKSVIEEHQRRPYHIIPCFDNGVPGNSLNGKIQYTRQQSMKQQGEPVHPQIDRLHLPGKCAVPARLDNPGAPLSSGFPVTYDVFFFQISDFFDSAFDIRLANMNSLHLIPLQHFINPQRSRNVLPVILPVFPVPVPSSAYMFPVSRVPPAPCASGALLTNFSFFQHAVCPGDLFL